MVVHRGASGYTVWAYTSSPLAYQWLFDRTIPVEGGTQATLLLAGGRANQAGSYSVVISSASGSVTSAVAALTVVARQQLLHVTNSPWRFSDQGDQGTA